MAKGPNYEPGWFCLWRQWLLATPDDVELPTDQGHSTHAGACLSRTGKRLMFMLSSGHKLFEAGVHDQLVK